MFYVLICREEDDEVLKEMPIESLRKMEQTLI